MAVSLRREAPIGSRPSGPAVIDYRLARRLLIQEFRDGHVSRTEVCDAHPELKRAAANCGTATETDCPICGKANVVLLTYAFGPRLPKSGRLITTAKELKALRDRPDEFTGYVVEVCPECSWNHLGRTFTIG